MAKERSPNRDKALEIFKEHKGNIQNREIANILDENEKTISNWKCRDKWNVVLQGKQCSTTKKKGGQPGNKNATGPPRNNNAETNGFFSKYLPEDTFNIIQEIKEKNPLDILWENIQIQYAAIIRAQKIMQVKDKDEMIKVLKKETRGDKSDTDEWEFQFAWDRQANFLQAQSRAMTTLERMIKNYDDMLHKNWELATEEQKARIEFIKSKVTNTEIAKEDKIDSYFKMLEDSINVK